MPPRPVRAALPRALLALLAAPGCAPAPPGTPGPLDDGSARPDVLLICLDTVRPDDLGLFEPAPNAPFLASLAAGGTVFEGACSTSSWTAPATASLLTGLYPRRHGVLTGFFAQEHASAEAPGEARAEEGPEGAGAVVEFTAIHPHARPLAEVLAEAGYATFCVATNLNIGPEIGFERGFERFASHDGWPAEQALALVDSWHGELAAARPWFLYVHLNDAHEPYLERAPWYRAQPEAGPLAAARARYRSEIAYTDAVLQDLFELLAPEAGSVVAVVSDHGEEFLEHGGRFHRFSLHGELNRALLLLSAPGRGVQAQRVPSAVSLVDVVPTLLELAGLPAPALDGLSLAPLARGLPGAAEGLAGRTVFAHRLHPRAAERELWAAMDGRWKLIEGPKGPELYDLWADPGEREDVHGANPQAAARLAAALDGHRSVAPRRGATRRLELDPELHERLRELGYTEAGQDQ